MEPMGLPQCVREESTLLWEPFMFCFQEKGGGEGELLLSLTRFLKQKTKAMQLRLHPPPRTPRQKTRPQMSIINQTGGRCPGRPQEQAEVKARVAREKGLVAEAWHLPAGG